VTPDKVATAPLAQPLPRLEPLPLDALPAALLYPLARVGAAAVTVMGTADMRERLRLAQAGQLREADAEALGAELNQLAGLLTRS
jgi:hypothetical protein